jgi:hypothetical protein
MQVAGLLCAALAIFRLLMNVERQGNLRTAGPIDPEWLRIVRGAVVVGILLWLAGTRREFRSRRGKSTPRI